jgi:hypothetical protein
VARTPNRFTASNGATYDWTVNHDEEESFGKTRNVEATALLKGGGMVLQQADDGPLVITVSGTIFHVAQIQAFDWWMAWTKQQTIHFTDFAGDVYEVIITSFQPKRQRTLRNPRDPSAPLWYWKYTLEMHVITVISGTRGFMVI